MVNKREALMKAAFTLSMRCGLNGWSNKDLSRESGVPLGNIHYYFQSKRQLQETVRQALETLMPESLRTQVQTMSADERQMARLIIDISEMSA